MTSLYLVRARPVLTAAFATGVVATGVLWAAGLGGITASLCAWCLTTSVYVVFGSLRLSGQSAEDLKRSAAAFDDGAVAILGLSLAAAAASFVAVVGELGGVATMTSSERAAHLALVGTTIVCSWFFVQMIFAVHYAHIFYGGDDKGGVRGGLDFAGEDDPDFWDFAYFSITVGATSQTSDTDVDARTMRRTVMAHGIFAFFFNTTILALSINIAAGLLK